MEFSVTGGDAVIAPEADFTISPTNIQCATTVDITITDNSIGNQIGILEMEILIQVIIRPFKLILHQELMQLLQR